MLDSLLSRLPEDVLKKWPAALTKLVPESILKEWIIESFHRIWYEDPNTWPKNTYLGVDVQQLPLDLWLYQEIIASVKPKHIVQTGVCGGGSVLFFAHLLDAIGAGPESLVVGVDIELRPSARAIKHPRVHLFEGSSVAPEVVDKVRALVPQGSALVSLDSDHSQGHVAKEIEAYKDFTAVGSYMVIEDTNINGHPVRADFGPGPMEAADAFLARNTQFMRDDPRWKRNLISFHQYGWLRRVA